MRHIPIARVFWRGPLIARVHIWRIRGGIPPQITFHVFPVYEALTGDPLTTTYLSSDLLIVPGEAQSPIYDLGPLSLHGI